jgi:phosphatidylglycerophosphatase A
MNTAICAISRAVATVGFVGYMPFASGTCGTLVAMIYIWLLKPSFIWQLTALGAVLVIGTITAGIAEKSFGEKDSQYIVIDEFAGYMCSIICLPLTPLYIIAAFLLFRVFDIVKPWPVCLFEKIGGGAGIMLDDVAAGIITNMLLQVLVTFVP